MYIHKRYAYLLEDRRITVKLVLKSAGKHHEGLYITRCTNFAFYVTDLEMAAYIIFTNANLIIYNFNACHT